jgi:glycosyltransferase involved in cell wall biosynthesis
VLASSSKREGWGMSITEAAACGTPAVATDIGGHRDVIVHGETGLLAGDEGLAPALVEVLTDRPRREAMGAAALRASQQYSWGTTAVEMMRLLAADAARHRT